MMRFSKLLIAAGAAAIASATAAGQEAEPETKAEAQNEAEPPRLPEIDVTLDALGDEAIPTEEGAAAQEEPAEAPEPAAAAGPPPPPPPLTAEQRAALERAVLRGRQLAAIAQAGQIATRDMLSRIEDPEAAGIGGWLVEPAGNGMTVTFYGEGARGPVAVYRATLLGGRVTDRDVFPADARPALSPVQARMAAARVAAEAQEHRACSPQGFNYFVVPPETPNGAVDVYQVSAQAERGRFPFGGHFRTTVPARGEATARGFTNGCVDVAVPELAAGTRPPPIGVTHLLDPLPTEIHVFLSMWAGRPLLIATGSAESENPERVWLVTPDGIAEIPPEAAAGR